MKFSAALSLGLAPLALAKAVHNVYPVERRTPNRGGASQAVGAAAAIGVDPAILAAAGLRGLGLTANARTEVILIWVNGGGGAQTTSINQQQTVTRTVTVNNGQAGGAAQQTPPPANGGAVASNTVAPGASSVVAGTGATHTVTVGGPKGLQFEPTELKAAVGDMVIFTFLSQNHTATQSAFDKPCEPLAGGMDSSFQPNPNNSVNPPPQVAMQVMVETPLWFFCAQAKHCGKGMTFSINPTAEKTQAMFQQMAIAQNGGGTGSAITGNGSAAAPPPPAGGAAAPPANSLTATLGAGTGGAAATGTAAAPAGTGVVSGVGTLNPDGSCSCSVQCAPGAFPAVQAQGIGSFGGMAGGIPANMVGAA
ncbi:uncharacterized protein E0L32_008061 [Thyridium curvatum]|uniref:Serine-threonine rich protein n=1 Tax=Thyridium curvatum TaxID=1093900 RepID=A0A507AX52_9PEZI|nr:uncharacterized protein E0L32_008061 [Thyridium curvatum]TPX11024.1 hypothetical protein E0L32_008061 [Thyridium curvatum]